MRVFWVLLAVIAVVTAIESRVAVDTWMGHREFLYRPFVMRPGTNIVEGAVHWVKDRQRGDGTLHESEVGHGHCTCGSPGPREVVLYLILPPAFCLVVGMLGAMVLLALRGDPWMTWGGVYPVALSYPWVVMPAAVAAFVAGCYRKFCDWPILKVSNG